VDWAGLAFHQLAADGLHLRTFARWVLLPVLCISIVVHSSMKFLVCFCTLANAE
jgi:hypothetical protein